MFHKFSALILIIIFLFSSPAQAKFSSDDPVDEMQGYIKCLMLTAAHHIT